MRAIEQVRGQVAATARAWRETAVGLGTHADAIAAVVARLQELDAGEETPFTRAQRGRYLEQLAAQAARLKVDAGDIAMRAQAVTGQLEQG
jgi:hypothetical protein